MTRPPSGSRSTPEDVWRALRPGQARVDVIDGQLTLDIQIREAMVRAQLRGFPLPHTIVEAHYVMEAGPPFAVAAMGPISALRRRFFDLQDHELGDAEFDERYLVQGRDRDAIASAWTPRARALRLRLPLCELHATHRTVTLTRIGASNTPADLDGFLDLVAELAHADHAVCQRWLALPGAVARPASGARDTRVSPGVDLPDRSCRVRAVERWRRPVAQVVGWLPRYVPAFNLNILESGALDSDPPRNVLPLEPALLDTLSGANLRGADGALEITFPRLTVEFAALEAATRLCHAAATLAGSRR